MPEGHFNKTNSKMCDFGQNCFWNFNTADEKASFISQRSISFFSIPARLSAFKLAGVGTVSMMVGSEPTVDVDRILARGFKPSAFPFSSEPTNTRLAPSTIPEEFPAVWTCLIFFKTKS